MSPCHEKVNTDEAAEPCKQPYTNSCMQQMNSGGETETVALFSVFVPLLQAVLFSITGSRFSRCF